MTDRQDQPRDAHDLVDRVSELGDTPEDALEEVAGRNESLEERLPGADQGGGDADTDADARGTKDLPRGEGAPGQG
ncbi:hypothetical protein ASF88_14650 [Leifsonia sp. Leaf336]|uniref:hypothetical protein n=1 Tax=Leifsonia sp. Leaf336 TaxID=1736341 RepID=UPI0006F617DE|nr:hypothetical protein [Leifsonia sp. Leaf336]KQR52726.1 hypothetical protein ASF88_14650 [Leifsonia sp. Leaf336]